MYPLKFTPLLFHKIWGGHHIEKWYDNVPSDYENVGESWVISAQPKYPTLVCNGSLAGNELQELLEVYMGELVGDSVFAAYGNMFPVLVKFIDADDDLSIQVHPDDEQAWEAAESLGKNEMWYVVEGSDADASIISGWNRPMSEASVRQSIADGSLVDKLHVLKVAPGDVIPIPTGTVHAMKKGTIVAEIQENSDITYRLYDYDRVGNDGLRRPIHLEKALQVLNFDEGKRSLISPEYPLNAATNIARTPYFTTNVLSFDRTIQRDYAPLDSFVIYMCVGGSVEVQALDADEEQLITLCKGEALLLPAVLNDIVLTPASPEARLLEVYVEPDLE